MLTFLEIVKLKKLGDFDLMLMQKKSSQRWLSGKIAIFRRKITENSNKKIDLSSLEL
jgi:hypothetical protein